MRDFPGSTEANYWLSRHRLRKEFGLTAAEADLEPLDETLIHLKIWELLNEREKKETAEAERKAKINSLKH